MSLQGVLPILPTPFTSDGAVDEGSMRRLIDFELEVGAHGVSVLGFMGEAHRLAGFERKQVVAASVEQASGAFSLFLGLKKNSRLPRLGGRARVRRRRSHRAGP